ncbi:MAG: FAD:protein FMN transferase [Pseudomonadales bacterium]|nr:FAD:protein FMN transferase [Pseudomonadales bacterium]
MKSQNDRKDCWDVTPFEAGWKCTFTAMASPCEILWAQCSIEEARGLSEMAFNEVKRIEQKFSRYRDDNIVYQINNSNGQQVDIDDEVGRLLTFADQCYQVSDGLFDITSGVLRKVWRFDGSDKVPNVKDIVDLLPLVGWEKVRHTPSTVQLNLGMELDFGGIGKEYAVDRVLLMLSEQLQQPMLINFGGDIATNGVLFPDHHWSIGVEAISNEAVAKLLNVSGGAIATSGDSRRFLLRDGVRYTHVLNPKTGWPIENAPHSMTVAAPSCVQAGMLSTIALLQGENAETFLDEMDVTYWSQR